MVVRTGRAEDPAANPHNFVAMHLRHVGAWKILSILLRMKDPVGRRILAAAVFCGSVCLVLAVAALCAPMYEERVTSAHGVMDLKVNMHAFYCYLSCEGEGCAVLDTQAVNPNGFNSWADACPHCYFQRFL